MSEEMITEVTPELFQLKSGQLYEIGQQFYHPKHNPLYLQYSSNSYQNHGHSEYPG